MSAADEHFQYSRRPQERPFISAHGSGRLPALAFVPHSATTFAVSLSSDQAAPVLTLDQTQDSLYMRKKRIAGFVIIGPDLRDDRFVKFA